MGVKKKVLVFGGGIGGLSAAHELTEQGRAGSFEVAVVEAATACGGKARSQRVPGIPPSANPYPGEHGFRFFPTFYRHVVDTMSRIPSGFSGRASVADHLQSTPLRMIARYGNPPIVMPTSPASFDPFQLLQFIESLFGSNTGLTLPDLLLFADRLLQIATSSKSRRRAEYETVSWWQFVDADHQSQAFRHYLASGLTRTLVAAKPNEINAMTGGDVLVRILIDSGVQTVPAAADRVLDGPTSDVWIDPWTAELRRRGVTFTQASLLSLNLAHGNSIAGARVARPDGAQEVLTADYYILALPVEHAAAVVAASPQVAAAGQRLSDLATLKYDVRSMTGLQLYLNAPLNLPPHLGHALYVDSEWALTSIAQSTFWRAPFDDLGGWGGGDIRTVWSIILSDWTSDFPSGGGPDANHSPLRTLLDATVAQLVASLNGDGIRRFDPATIVAWNLDAAVTPGDAAHPAVNSLPLLVNKPDRWRIRPDAAPAGLQNLMLAADYVRTNTDLATMEGANEAARRAVNAILTAEGIADTCAIWELYYPEALAGNPEWAARIADDEERFQRGHAWQAPYAAVPRRP